MTDRFLSHDEVMSAVFSPEEEAAYQRLAPARDLALLVIEHRMVHSLSQRDVARLMGVSQPWIVRLEAAEHLPTIETLQKVAALLGRDIRLAVPAPPKRSRSHPRSVQLSAAGRQPTALATGA